MFVCIILHFFSLFEKKNPIASVKKNPHEFHIYIYIYFLTNITCLQTVQTNTTVPLGLVEMTSKQRDSLYGDTRKHLSLIQIGTLSIRTIFNIVSKFVIVQICFITDSGMIGPVTFQQISFVKNEEPPSPHFHFKVYRPSKEIENNPSRGIVLCTGLFFFARCNCRYSTLAYRFALLQRDGQVQQQMI